MAAEAAYSFATVSHRNITLANLAASDAFHDFDDMGRVGKTVKDSDKNIMPKIWNDEKKIGTLPDPTDHKSEEALFEEIIGVPLSIFRTPGRKGNLNILSAGANTIQYEWETVVAYEAVGDEMRYKPSLGLFNAITGNPAEKTIYFMIDAINVSIHKALIHDKYDEGAATEKNLIYLETRERLNDPADNRRMDHYVKNSEGSKVGFQIFYDEYTQRVSYPKITETSTQPSQLFNSIFTLSLEAKQKSKEGLASSTLTFRRDTGAALKTVTVQNGAVENDNSVNSLYQRLVDFFRGAKTPTALEDYFIALQQKRSGDWLQVLAALDTRRFPQIPASAPIFLASLDRLCVLYGLCVGANMIYTFQRGNSYCFTVFRRKQKLSAADRRKENVEALQNILRGLLGAATNLKEAPIIAGGIPYEKAVALYLRFVGSKTAAYAAAIDQTFKALSAQYAALAGGRFTDESTFNGPLRLAIKPLYDFLLFSRAFPQTLEAVADVTLTLADIKETEESIQKAAAKLTVWQYVVGVFRDLFATADASWSTSEAAMETALEVLFKKFDASNRERDQALASIDMKKELYDQPILAVFQQLETFLPKELLAPIDGLFDAMTKKATDALQPGVASATRVRAMRLRMNAAMGKYVLLRSVDALPVGVIPSFSALLTKLFVHPTPDRKKNIFAIHRIIAKAYQNFVDSNVRLGLIQAFKAAYDAAAAGVGVGAASGGSPRAARGRMVRKTVALPIGVLPSLFLATQVLKEMMHHEDAHPFEVSPFVYSLLKNLMADATIRKVYASLPHGIPVPLYRAAYSEAVGYFIFFVLQRIDINEDFARIFERFDKDHVKEIGGILKDSILGSVRESTEEDDDYFLPLIGYILRIGNKKIGADIPEPDISILQAIQERMAPIDVSTGERSRSRGATRKRSRGIKRSGSRSRSGSGSRSASRRGAASRSSSRSGRLTKRKRSVKKASLPKPAMLVEAD